MGLLDSLIQSQVGPYSISEDEKKRLKRAGLLQAGLAMLATPTGTGSPLMGISRGLLAGVDSMQQGAQDNIAMQYKMDRLGAQSGVPADIQTIEYYQQHPEAFAMQMKLRQASANPFGYQVIEGQDGVPRLVQTNKREGGAEVVSPTGTPQAPDVMGQLLAFGTQPGVTMTSGPRTPGHNADVGGKPNSQHLAGTAMDYAVPPENKAAFIALAQKGGFQAIDEGDHIHLQIPRASRGPNPFEGRRAEDVAAAKAEAEERAKIGVQVGAAPLVAGAEALVASAKTKAEADARAQADRDSVVATRSQDANRALGLLDEADKLIDQSTGSGIGHAADEALGFFGKSTKGAEAIASLQTVSGQLISMMPRMQGPQSDKDVLLYKQMAGDLANPLIPRERRKAAAATIRELQQKYATGQQSAPVKRLKYNPATGMLE